MTDLIHQTLAQRRGCLVGGLSVVLHRGQLSDRSQSHCMCQGEMIHLYVGKANSHTLSELPHREHSIYDMQQEIVWPEQFQSHLQVDVPPCCGNWRVSFHRREFHEEKTESCIDINLFFLCIFLPFYVFLSVADRTTKWHCAWSRCLNFWAVSSQTLKFRTSSSQYIHNIFTTAQRKRTKT